LRFNSDELLKEFGNDHFETPGLWCRCSHSCFDCDLVWGCRLVPHVRNDTEEDTEEEPCGYDYVIREIHHGWDLRKYAFKKYSHDKAWHDSQEKIVVTV